MYHVSKPTKLPVCKNEPRKGLNPKNLVWKAPASPQQKNETGTACLPTIISIGTSTNAIKNPNLAQCKALRFRKREYPWKCYLSWDFVDLSVSTAIYELNSNDDMKSAITTPIPADTLVIINTLTALLMCDYSIILSVNEDFNSNWSSSRTICS